MLAAVAFALSAVAFVVALYAFALSGRDTPDYPDCSREGCDTEARYVTFPSRDPLCAYHSHGPDLSNEGALVHIEEVERTEEEIDA